MDVDLKAVRFITHQKSVISSSGGKFTGRSLAWNESAMSKSMPNIDFTASSVATSQTFPRSSQGGEGGFPVDGSKRYKKHSGPGRMLKKEFKIIQGKANYRYKNSDGVTREETAVDSFDNDDFEVNSRSTLPPRPSYAGSDLNKTLRDQNRDIANKLKDLPGSNRKSTSSYVDNGSCEDSPEMVSLDQEEPNSRPELEHRSSFSRSLKYSRAFQQKASAAQRMVLNDVECEDVDEIADAPFAVTNLNGPRKSGIACN